MMRANYFNGALKMFNETELGFELRKENKLIFFGKRNCTLEDLQKKYPVVEFRTVRQTHSKTVISSVDSSQKIEADAHYTDQFNIGLIIKTADCLPILIYSVSRHMIAAVHAGWRGVENQITLETFKILPPAKDYNVYIGPHILQRSFEVKEDVKDQILKASYSLSPNLSYKKEDRYFINLQEIVKSQILSQTKANIYSIDFDTYQNHHFNSFRTDQTTSRNLSFIAQLRGSK